MIYGKYKSIRNAVWQALIDFKINSLPIFISDITEQLDIKTVDNKDVDILKKGERGVTICTTDCWYIIVDETEEFGTQRFTVAHELAHILLGHLLVGKIRYRTFAVRSEQEASADMFAARLLTPACILHELQILTPEAISKLCCVSISCAKIRAERMAELEQRNKYYLHPLERQVREQFREFINSYNE